jgi:hypothetical protein
MRRKPGPAATAGALAVALALVLIACGGSNDTDGVASLTDTSGQSTTNGSQSSGGGSRDFEKAQLEYAKCMREHGVDFPDPVNGRFQFKEERGDQRKLDEAQKACRDILEKAKPPVTEEQEAEMREAALKFAKCMRQHGVDMPDPTFPEGGGTLMRMPKGMKDDDPKLEAAQKACQPIMEAARPDGSPGQRGSS